MTREIGSEFHASPFESGHGLDLPISGELVFSGRTAIETVLKNIPEAKKAFLPSYCCESMIQPFREARIEIAFYNVWYDGGLCVDVAIPPDIDIFLWCNYFGYINEMPNLTNFRQDGGVVIEDITHSLLSTSPYHEQADYLVASLRKWEPIICGGYCAAVGGRLQHAPTVEPPESFIRLKYDAMQLKAEYLRTYDESKKPLFLKMFGDSNHWLAENYSVLSIDTWSREYISAVDVESQREIRRTNAYALYEGLQGTVQFLFQEEAMDCPLFVPIVIPHDREHNRDDIRRYLTAHNIYCPIHWPKPQGCDSNLYDMELSLVCDQRYTVEDMKRIVSVLESIL